jgi:hypothetical protein
MSIEDKYEKCKILYYIYEGISKQDSDFLLYLTATDKTNYIINLYKIASTPLFDIIKSLFSITCGYVYPYKFIINILLVFSSSQNTVLVYKQLIEDIRDVSKEDQSYFEILIKSKNELDDILFNLTQQYDRNIIRKMPVSKILSILKNKIY